MSLRLSVNAWQADLPPLQKYVALALAELSGSDGEYEYWDGDIARLAEFTNLSEGGAWQCIEGLIDTGEIVPARERDRAEWIVDGSGWPGVQPKDHGSRPSAPAPSPRKDGYVYLLESGGVYKIGRSVNPSQRVEQIKPVMPYPVQTVHQMYAEDCAQTEAQLHRQYQDKRLNGEWFALSAEDVAAIKGLSS